MVHQSHPTFLSLTVLFCFQVPVACMVIMHHEPGCHTLLILSRTQVKMQTPVPKRTVCCCFFVLFFLMEVKSHNQNFPSGKRCFHILFSLCLGLLKRSFLQDLGFSLLFLAQHPCFWLCMVRVRAQKAKLSIYIARYVSCVQSQVLGRTESLQFEGMHPVLHSRQPPEGCLRENVLLPLASVQSGRSSTQHKCSKASTALWSQRLIHQIVKVMTVP